ncbi:MAG: hypothetical protein F4053_11665 [Proteobacteria bacterium]|nr:hypothetical protein [Pseudomonadota bacterium]MYJ96205.1 hypothetical protein [Pseudomonadota bacterium]
MEHCNARRNFLRTAGTAGLLTLPIGRAISGVSLLAAIDIDPEAARIIGRSFLEAYPEEWNTRRLLTSVAHVDAFNVNVLIQRDFAAGRTVSVDGWVLSQTEARLCAAAMGRGHRREINP